MAARSNPRSSLLSTARTAEGEGSARKPPFLGADGILRWVRWGIPLFLLWMGWERIDHHRTWGETLWGMGLWVLALWLLLKLLPDLEGSPVFSGVGLEREGNGKDLPWPLAAICGLGVLLLLRGADLLIHKDRWFPLLGCLLLLGWGLRWMEGRSAAFVTPGSQGGYRVLGSHVLLLLSFGGFFLFYRLPEWPDFMWRDGALTMDCGRRFLTGEFTTPFITDWGENPCFAFMLFGVAFKIGGATPWTAKVFIALVNLVGALFFYATARFFLPRNSALFIALIYATSRWLALYSRTPHDGVNIITAFEVAALFFFIRAVEKGGKRDFAVFGVLMALILDIYLSSRFVLAFFLSATLVLWCFRSKEMARQWVGWATAWGTALVWFLPMAAYYHDHPNTLLGRIKEINVFHFMEKTGDPGFIWRNAMATLRMFNVEGSHDARFNLEGVQLLGPLEGLCLLLGMAWCLSRPFRPAVLVLLLGFFGGLCTTILTWDIAHPMRALVAAPFVYLIVGIGLDRSARVVTAPLGSQGAPWRILLMAGAFLWAFSWNYDVFFERFPKAKRTWLEVEGPHVLAGKTLASYPAGWDHYLPSGFAHYDTEVFYTRGKGSLHSFLPGSSLPLKAVPPKGALVLLPRALGDAFEDWMRQLYPEARRSPVPNRFGEIQFWKWELTPQEVQAALDRKVPVRGGAWLSWYDPGGRKLGAVRIPSVYDMAYWVVQVPPGIGHYEVEGILSNPQGRGLALEAMGPAELFIDGRKAAQVTGKPGTSKDRVEFEVDRYFVNGSSIAALDPDRSEATQGVSGTLRFKVRYRPNTAFFSLNLLWREEKDWIHIPSSALGEGTHIQGR